MDSRSNHGRTGRNGGSPAPATAPEPPLRPFPEPAVPASEADAVRLAPPSVRAASPGARDGAEAPRSTDGVSDGHASSTDGEGAADESGGFVAALASVTEPFVSVASPIVDHIVLPVAGAIGNALEAASNVLGVRTAIADHLMGRSEVLPNLYDVHPEAREASPRELGFRFVPIEEIKGTAVAGIAQRGPDFLPLRAFRGSNWEGRWKRIKLAYDRLTPLPPVDLIRFDGDYWVVDGHNRVAAAIAGKGVGLDAMVVELVPLDGQVSELPGSVLAFMGEAADVRNAAMGRTPALDRVLVPEMPLPVVESTATSETGPGGEGRRADLVPEMGSPEVDVE